MASIFRRGLVDPDDLDDDESIRFTFVFSMLIAQLHNAFEDTELGIIPRETLYAGWAASLKDVQCGLLAGLYRLHR